jgi:hypothetical protein
MIDIFGTVLLARVPLLITPMVRFIPYFESFTFMSPAMYLVVSILIISLVWNITLLFNAYRISCNLKNESLVISFLISILLSEVLVRYLNHLLI